jgi:O-antigen ligase
MLAQLSALHRYLFYVLVFSVPWQTLWIIREFYYDLEKWHYGTIGIYASDILLLLWVLIGCYLYRNEVYQFFSTHKKITITIFAFCAWIFFSIIWSQNKFVALYFALKISFFIDLFILICICKPPIRSFFTAFVLSMTIHGMLGIYQFITQDTFASTLFGLHAYDIWHGTTATITFGNERWLRMYGGFPHPNIMGGFTVIALIFAMWLYVAYKERKEWICSLLISSISILFISMILTFSRATWGAAIITFTIFFVYIFLYQKNKCTIRRSYLLIIIFITLSFLTVFLYTDLFTARSSHTNTYHNSYSDRKDYITQAQETISKYPLLGTGAGNYTNTIARDEKYIEPIWHYQPVHNSYVLIVAEIGVIGLILLLMLIFTIFPKRSPRSWSSTQKIISLSILALMITSFFDHWTWTSHAGLLLSFILLGFFTAYTRKDRLHFQSKDI